MKKVFSSVLLIACLTGTINIAMANKDKEPTLATLLYTSYNSIKTISCQIRKTTTMGDNTKRLLSQVYYRAPSCLHVDNVAPVKRRIISDGETLYYHVDGNRKGFSSPLKDLKGAMLASFQNIPGTAVEHLIKIKDLAETQIPATDEFPLRRGYQATNFFVLLSCDKQGRLKQIDFFKTAKMKELGARYSYDSFSKVNDTVWIPTLHKAIMFLPNGKNITETTRIDNLTVNKPIAANLFNPNTFFDGITFVDKLEDTKE